MKCGCALSLMNYTVPFAPRLFDSESSALRYLRRRILRLTKGSPPALVSLAQGSTARRAAPATSGRFLKCTSGVLGTTKQACYSFFTKVSQDALRGGNRKRRRWLRTSRWHAVECGGILDSYHYRSGPKAQDPPG